MKKSKTKKLISLFLIVCILFSLETMAAASPTTEADWDSITINKAGENICLKDDKLNSFQNYPSLPVIQTADGSYIQATPQTATDWAIPLRPALYTFGYTVAYDETMALITVNGTAVSPIFLNGINYITLTECNNKISGFYGETRTFDEDTSGDVYLVFYQYNGTAHGTLTDEEFSSKCSYLKSFVINNFYVSYNSQYQSAYTMQAINNVQSIAESYPKLTEWKAEFPTKEYTELLGDFNENIPVFEVVRNDNIINKPVVIVQHGLGGKKEEMLSFMSELAAEGYRVISIDAYGHGERRANNQATSITAMQVVMRLTIDWDTVLAYYKTLSNVSLKNFAMAGFSMGGLATYNQLAFGQYKPTVIAPLIATPDFKSIVEVSGGNNEDYPDAYCVRISLPYSETTLTPEQLSELLLLNNNQKSLSPYNTLVNNVDWQNTALLALYSSNDTIVPHSGTVNLQNSIPFGGTPHIFGNMRCGHYVSEQDQSGVVNFIQAHLPVNRNLVDITLKVGSNVCVIFDTIYTANNTAPVLSAEGEMFLPIRSISTSALGYSVEYDAETGNVELTDGNHIVTVISNSDLIYINGRSFLTTANYSRYLNVQCQIVNSDGGSYVVLYKDSYQYAILNQAKASIYVAQYQNLTEA